MNTSRILTLALGLCALAPAVLQAQTFNSGSNGSHGAVELLPPAGRDLYTNMVAPPDGVFHFTTITVGPRARVTFTPNALNTPIYLLATGDVIINGVIDVNGTSGSPSTGGLGGPGGFDGGHPGFASIPPGDGFGPGAGRSGQNCNPPGTAAECVGGGSYGSVGIGNSTNRGSIYGSPLLIPLVGGSGGGAAPGAGGGGGGGAILIASNTRIVIGGGIVANGGAGAATASINGGSGGAIRLVAPVVAGPLNALHVNGFGGSSGSGRIRIDALDRTQLEPSGLPVNASFGKFMSVFPPVPSRLSLVSVAGHDIPEGTNAPVNVMLPFGSDTNQTVRVQARDFVGIVPIEVVVTPQNGPRQVFPAEINMSAGNPAFANVDVVIPLNTEAVIHAWTR